MTDQSQNPVKPKISGKQNLMGDILFLLLLLLTYTIGYFVFIGLRTLCDSTYMILPFILISSFVSLMTVALVLPRPKPGKYKLGSKGAILWYVTLLFGRIWGNPAIRFLLFSNTFTRTIFLKACGAKISFNHNCSPYVEIHDPAMLNVGDGVIFGMHAKILGHYIAHGHLILADITIGDGTLIGGNVGVAPGARIGKNVMIEVSSYIFPKAILPDNCHISRHSVITKHANLKEGERVPPYTNYDEI
ncbi:MAG: hypothetical protein EP326_00840 [Deltaproteobacteria bacterium]|nr:MAG: hypothetical protein EP326_00840 [Deltaproteobacteria bacterium]